ncbi:69df3757-7534-448a-94f0-a57c67f8e179 [Sclerotinia trifoliorum]|uniref:69df3757-7534-448a-94f0-a57c67f8e179 n=1 Tax=Sclerotinia trifoliorum TaxID=28548 RepID=A0A8H2ZSE6_9HELO|nr:69df3757-7534-448a-94f0-a57c67f8e179 [Sclerotinia trifoliorum]
MRDLTILPTSKTAGITVFIIFLAFFFKILHRAYFTSLSKIPGPWHARLTHLVLQYHIVTGTRIHYIHSLHHTYGQIVRISPTEVSCSSLPSFLTIHPISKPFLKSTWYQSLVPPPAGILSMVDPKEHAARRKLFSQAFSKSFLKTNWEPEVRKKAAMAVAKIKRDALIKEADILTFFTFMATDVVAHLAFGESFNLLENENKTQLVHDLQHEIGLGSLRAEFPTIFAIGKFLHIPLFQTAEARIREYGAIAVKNARSQSQAIPTIFRKVLTESKTENAEGSMSDRSIVSEAAFFIVVGTDTTAISITYLLYNILKDPNLQKQLEDEVETLGEDFEAKDVEQLVLLNAAIDEGMRLWGAAPGSLPRIVPNGGAMLDGYQVEGGVTVSTQGWTIHRNPEIYPEPDSFQPQRWLGEKSTEMKAAYHPYGSGTRTCIGIHLARMEIWLSLALFLRECKGARIALSQTDDDMEPRKSLVIEPKGGKCMITMTDGY